MTMRYAEHLRIEQQHLPEIAEQHLLGRMNTGGLQRIDHSGLEIMITRQPDTRRRQFINAMGKVMIGLQGLILSQIASRCDDIDLAVLCFYSVQHSAIAAEGVHPQQRFVLTGKEMSICNLPVRTKRCWG